ncbi:MAG: cellulase family glycosylhydrolase [Acidimicrobiales bacterium]
MTVVAATSATSSPLAAAAVRSALCARPSTPDVVAGCIRAPGDAGGFLRDAYGRDLIMHGVNAVEKVAPFDFSPVSGQRNSLTDTDAKEMASLGFDIVRLGILWQGLEPGTATLNNPSICTEGLVQGQGTAGPGGSDSQYAPATLATYLAQVKQTVDMLAAHGIYSLVDMHQDVYNQYFAGEGAPAWAVCTNGLPATNTGNWSANYFEPATGAALEHFWDNDVVGGLQQNYDAVWHQVATTLAGDSGVIGYDVFNEPFSAEGATAVGNVAFDARLECFYTGTAHSGEQSETHLPLACPATDPAIGAIGAIESADPHHLVFYEPDVFNDFGDANWIGPMPYPNLVLGFHDYCLASDGQAYYDFYSSPLCADPEQLVMQQQSAARQSAASAFQRGGPAWFMSEFGAGEDTTDLTRVADLANTNLLGWTYWQWKLYGDPTGGSTEALVSTDSAGVNHIDPVKASVIVQPVAQAVAGTPLSMSYDPSTRDYELVYRANRAIAAPTIVFVPVDAFFDVYPAGYCATVSGASLSGQGGARLLLSAHRSTTVTLHVTPGTCQP